MEEKGPDWDDMYKEGEVPWQRTELNPAFDHWRHEKVLKPCRILVPGCGTSPEIVELARAGFDVTALDISKTAIEEQKRMLDDAQQSATLVVDDVLTWMPLHGFEMIYEQTCLCALHPEDRHHYHHQLRHWLKPEGKLLALFMQTGRKDGLPYDCPLEEMKDLFTEEHWHWPSPPYFQSKHSDGLYEIAVVLTRHELPLR